MTVLGLIVSTLLVTTINQTNIDPDQVVDEKNTST